MDKYKNLVKVIAIQDLILANPKNPCVSIDFLSRLSQKLHLNRGATSFLRKFPHVFCIYYDPNNSQPFCRLTDTAIEISCQEAEAINASLPLVVDRLLRLLSMSTSKMLPLRAIFKVWRELGLPDDFEESVIARNSDLFRLCDAHEPNTHLLTLVDGSHSNHFTAAVENWRLLECWPRLRNGKSMPYVGPYEEIGEKKRSKAGMMASEKRAVAIIHEFLSLNGGEDGGSGEDQPF
uniref:PORR domain-containing protein n=1 Tax=Fagus sylvatica TaxID=28930 RepID=A0A2N9EPH2_FAGSY